LSAGHRHGHPIDAEEIATCKAMMREPKFKRARAKYTIEDNAHRVIYLAGSDNAGTTTFYDKDLADKIRIAKKRGGFASVDPRKFLRWHEIVEGILIRLYGFDYYKAHRFATAIERMMVERAGFVWSSYEKALRPMIHDDEGDSAKGSPSTLLLVAYRGSKWYRALERLQRKAA